MIGLVVATHSNLGRELLNAGEMIIGPLAQAAAVGIDPDIEVEEIRARIGAAIAQVDLAGQGVIIMTDMFGGTPSNLSLTYLAPDKVEVLTGVNLPMLLKFFNSREALDLTTLATTLKNYGQQSISLASDFLRA